MADSTGSGRGTAGGSGTLDAPPVPLPDLQNLSSNQVCGRACIWCHVTLDNTMAVDLGAREVDAHGSTTRWFPRACRGCAFQRIYAVLLDHTASCEQCADNLAQCAEGTALRMLMRVAR